MLRTTFTARKQVAAARLYVTARGIYEMFVNGTRVGDDHYNPGLTQYNVTHLYQTYDVTPLVRQGRNAIGAMLARGVVERAPELRHDLESLRRPPVAAGEARRDVCRRLVGDDRQQRPMALFR